MTFTTEQLEKTAAILQEILETNNLEDRLEYAVEDFEAAYILPPQEAELLYILVQAEAYRPVPVGERRQGCDIPDGQP